jgi:oxaloacetate decarboxylase gamma subunit
MSDLSLFSQALTLMVLGMGTVFIFLTILVFITKGMSSLISRFSKFIPDEEQLGLSTPQKYFSHGNSTTLLHNKDIILKTVITAAIHQHRVSKNR